MRRSKSNKKKSDLESSIVRLSCKTDEANTWTTLIDGEISTHQTELAALSRLSSLRAACSSWRRRPCQEMRQGSLRRRRRTWSKQLKEFRKLPRCWGHTLGRQTKCLSLTNQQGHPWDGGGRLLSDNLRAVRDGPNGQAVECGTWKGATMSASCLSLTSSSTRRVQEILCKTIVRCDWRSDHNPVQTSTLLKQLTAHYYNKNYITHTHTSMVPLQKSSATGTSLSTSHYFYASHAKIAVFIVKNTDTHRWCNEVHYKCITLQHLSWGPRFFFLTRVCEISLCILKFCAHPLIKYPMGELTWLLCALSFACACRYMKSENFFFWEYEFFPIQIELTTFISIFFIFSSGKTFIIVESVASYDLRITICIFHWSTIISRLTKKMIWIKNFIPLIEYLRFRKILYSRLLLFTVYSVSSPF